MLPTFEPCCACEYSGADFSQLYAFYRSHIRCVWLPKLHWMCATSLLANANTCFGSCNLPPAPAHRPPSSSTPSPPAPTTPPSAPSLFPAAAIGARAPATAAVPQQPQYTSPTANHPASAAALGQPGEHRMPWGGSAWVGPAVCSLVGEGGRALP